MVRGVVLAGFDYGGVMSPVGKMNWLIVVNKGTSGTYGRPYVFIYTAQKN